MSSESEPRVGLWYAGEHHAGAFRVIQCDLSSGVVHLKAADGRRVRMTLETWGRHPLSPAPDRVEAAYRPDAFEWHEPPIG